MNILDFVKTTTSSESVRYTGINDFRIISLNPPAEEGKKPKEYITTDGQNKRFQFEFVVQSADKKTILRTSYFVSNKIATSKAGKTLNIDHNSDGSYSTIEEVKNNPKQSFIDLESFRPSFEGERDLIMFLRNYTGLNLMMDENVFKTRPKNFGEIKFHVKKDKEKATFTLAQILETFQNTENANGEKGNLVTLCLYLKPSDGKNYLTAFSQSAKAGSNASLKKLKESVQNLLDNSSKEFIFANKSDIFAWTEYVADDTVKSSIVNSKTQETEADTW